MNNPTGVTVHEGGTFNANVITGPIHLSPSHLTQLPSDDDVSVTSSAVEDPQTTANTSNKKAAKKRKKTQKTPDSAEKPANSAAEKPAKKSKTSSVLKPPETVPIDKTPHFGEETFDVRRFKHDVASFARISGPIESKDKQAANSKDCFGKLAYDLLECKRFRELFNDDGSNRNRLGLKHIQMDFTIELAKAGIKEMRLPYEERGKIFGLYDKKIEGYLAEKKKPKRDQNLSLYNLANVAGSQGVHKKAAKTSKNLFDCVQHFVRVNDFDIDPPPSRTEVQLYCTEKFFPDKGKKSSKVNDDEQKSDKKMKSSVNFFLAAGVFPANFQNAVIWGDEKLQIPPEGIDKLRELFPQVETVEVDDEEGEEE